MNSKLFCSLALILILISGVGISAAQKPPTDVLYEVDFSSGTIPATISTSSANWAIKPIKIDGVSTQVLSGTSTGDIEYMSITSGTEWEHYSVEMQARFDGEQGFLLATRLDLTNPSCIAGYTAAILPLLESANVSATSVTDCSESELTSISSAPFPANTWVVLRVDTSGDSFAIYVDDEEYMAVQGGVTSAGTFGIFLIGMTVDIAYIRVSPLEGESLASGSTGVTLTAFGGTPQEAVAELVENGIVPNTGSLLFREDYAFFSGRGNWFTPLARSSRLTNVVMSGELTFKSGSDPAVTLETCSLSLRIAVDGSGRTTDTLDVEFVNEGSLLVREAVNGQYTNRDAASLGLDYSVPHSLLIVAIGDNLSVYVDGELAINNFKTTPRAGFFGIGLISDSRDSRCEGRNIWVYNYD